MKNALARARFFTSMHREFGEQMKLGQRKGQAWMNALGVNAPYLYIKVHDTEADCFHDDSRIPAFYKKIFQERMN